MANPEAEFERIANVPSDINEHLRYLRALATGLRGAAEIANGGQTGSTFALAAAVGASNLTCVTWTARGPLPEGVAERVEYGGVPEIPEVDLLFVDTWHVYGQLKRELAALAPRTRKYIVLHDTTIDWEHGEAVRCGQDAKVMSSLTGLAQAEITTGLRRAVEEFLEASPDWSVRARFEHNNGLLVLQRAQPPPEPKLAPEPKKPAPWPAPPPVPQPKPEPAAAPEPKPKKPEAAPEPKPEPAAAPEPAPEAEPKTLARKRSARKTAPVA